MATAGNIFEIVVKQTIQAQEILNVFYYKNRASVSDPALANLIADRFWTIVGTPWLPCVTDDVLFEKITVRNIFIDTEYGEKVFTNVKGTHTGSISGSRYSVFIPFNRANRSTRNGGKRISGFVSGAFIDNVLVTAEQTLFNSLATVMDNVLEVPDAASPIVVLDPVIVKRVPYTTPSGKPGYKLPDTVGSAVTNLFTSPVASNKPSSQASRKT